MDGIVTAPYDLQIVLNDDRAVYPNMERREWDFQEGSEDEDGDDLVIVASGDNPIEDQEWGAEATIPFKGVVSAPADKVLPADKTGDDKGQTGKVNVGIGNAGVPRVGYGSQHYHPHYSQYRVYFFKLFVLLLCLKTFMFHFQGINMLLSTRTPGILFIWIINYLSSAIVISPSFDNHMNASQ